MRNKARLLTNFGIILLVIGSSFLAGTIYRSTNTPSFSIGEVFESPPLQQAILEAHRSVLTYALPPRDLSIELKTNATVDLYLLDDEGRKLWLSEGTLKPVWSVKNTSSQAFTLQLPSRGNYGIKAFNPNNSTVTLDLRGQLYGYERDLLWFSLATTAMGLVITAASRIALLGRYKKLDIPPRKTKLGLLHKDLPANFKDFKVKPGEVKHTKQFHELIAWELEEYMAFPILEIIIVIAVCTVLSPTIIETSPALSYSNLLSGTQTIFLFLIFVAGVLFCHSYAGSISKGETKVLLSYPVQRGHLFLSKFIVLFTVLFAVYAGVFALQIYLLALNPFEPLFYVSLLFVALQLLLVCAISTALSVITKNEMLSILVSALLLFGLENVATRISLVSFTGRFTTGFAFVSQQVHGVLPPGAEFSAAPTASDALLSLFVSIGISVFLFVFSYVYYTRKMEID